MAFSDLASRLVGELPGLSPFLAETYVTDAWRDVCNARLWSFLMKEGAIPLPTQITAGTVTVTRFALTVLCDAAASTALTPYIAGTPLLTQMQFRAQGGSLYNILSVDATAPSALVLTLDREFVETGGAGLSYQVYRCYITAPNADFLRWESLDDFQHGYAITGDRVGRSRMEFDRRDPQRQSQGQAFYLGENKGQPTSSILWELWPHPTDGQTFITTYRSKGTAPDFSSTTDAQPPIIPDQLIVFRAMAWYGYPWAQANRGAFPRYARYNFIDLITKMEAKYNRLLLDVKRIDDEQNPQTVFNRGWQRGRGRAGIGLAGPADAAYWQSHPITW